MGGAKVGTEHPMWEVCHDFFLLAKLKDMQMYAIFEVDWLTRFMCLKHTALKDIHWRIFLSDNKKLEMVLSHFQYNGSSGIKHMVNYASYGLHNI